NPPPRGRSAGANSPSRRACAGGGPCSRRPPWRAPPPGRRSWPPRSRARWRPRLRAPQRRKGARKYPSSHCSYWQFVRPGYQGLGRKNQAGKVLGSACRSVECNATPGAPGRVSAKIRPSEDSMAKKRAEGVYKIVEVVGVSDKSWEEAGRNAVATAADS